MTGCPLGAFRPLWQCFTLSEPARDDDARPTALDVPIRRSLAGAADLRLRGGGRAGAAGEAFADYDALHAWSVGDPGAFWDLVWDFCGVIGEKGARRMVDGARRCGRRASSPMRG